MMQPFNKHRGLAALLKKSNVDTDQIIPKQFLKSIERTGFEKGFLFDYRFNADGSENPDFELNAPRYDGASILVTLNNFGCGSSREHAVWAVMQYGFRVVIAPRRISEDGKVGAFADIFRNNGFNNGLLTIELSEAEVDEIIDLIEFNEGIEATADLENQTVTFHGEPDKVYEFDIDPGVRHKLLEGLDPIAQTLKFERDITAFENEEKRKKFSPNC